MFDNNKGPANINRQPGSSDAQGGQFMNQGASSRQNTALYNNAASQNKLEEENKVEDIFSDENPGVFSQTSPKPSVLKPKMQNAGSKGKEDFSKNSRVYAPIQTEKDGQAQRLFFAFFLVVMLAILGFGGWYVYKKIFATTIPEIVVESEDKNTKQATTTQPEEEQVVKEVESDKDQDGLTDSEEAALGTDPNVVDSDLDGLFDKEEVDVYKTDPLNNDSDGDGYYDGAEVKQGFNPLGAGKLYDKGEEEDIVNELVCPSVCIPMWELDENGCVYNECGSGCGINDETSFGTEVDCLRFRNKDTDGDGLLDREEIEYGTNPELKDTDGDGYSDGDEVSNGYNPNGPGKLAL